MNYFARFQDFLKRIEVSCHFDDKFPGCTMASENHPVAKMNAFNFLLQSKSSCSGSARICGQVPFVVNFS